MIMENLCPLLIKQNKPCHIRMVWHGPWDMSNSLFTSKRPCWVISSAPIFCCVGVKKYPKPALQNKDVIITPHPPGSMGIFTPRELLVLPSGLDLSGSLAASTFPQGKWYLVTLFMGWNNLYYSWGGLSVREFVPLITPEWGNAEGQELVQNWNLTQRRQWRGPWTPPRRLGVTRG